MKALILLLTALSTYADPIGYTLKVQSGKASIKLLTPGPGSYYVMQSADMLAWKVIASGHVWGASHVSSTSDASGKVQFYRVEFMPAK